MLETDPDGNIAACIEDYLIPLGTFSAQVQSRAQALRAGLPLASLVSGKSRDKEADLLVRRLAQHGLLEYHLPQPRGGENQVVIEPQVADYWPRTVPLGDTDTLVLSRFAYLRRRAFEMVLESPRAEALLRIADPRIATVLSMLAQPRQIKYLRRQQGFPGLELLGLLVDCRILFKVDKGDGGLRPTEGDKDLVLWDFHDLLFHARSTEGRHANPLGGVGAFADIVAPLPAVRPCWPGRKINLDQVADAARGAGSPLARLFQERHSTRDFDEARPITLVELARFLDATARVLATWEGELPGKAGPLVTYAARPYPSAGAEYELELYLSVDKCDRLARGFYHYDAGAHALTPIDVDTDDLETLLHAAEYAMDAPAKPQILITIAARFGRVSWKYSAIAYGLILKNVGVLTQTLYLMAADMGLGGCAIGTANVELFAKMTGLEFHVEGPVGQFALGRGTAVGPQPPSERA